MAEQDPNTMMHTHVDENGNVITHCHGSEGHTHAHPHTHTQTKAVVNRLARAIGHLESVKRMVEDGATAPRCSSSLRPCARRSTTPQRSS